MPRNIEEPEVDQKNPELDDRFDPDDPKGDIGEPHRVERDDDEEREAGRGVVRNPASEVEEEELAEEDILEQTDIESDKGSDA